MPRRVLKGIVTSDVREKTITVKVEKKVKHPMYKKYIRRSCKYAAHDPANQYKVGDSVRIIETSPISRTKKWVVMDAEIASSASESLKKGE